MSTRKLPKRPGRYAGAVNPHTIERRGPMPLTAAQRREARRLRFELGWEFEDVAIAVGRSEADVRHSLANVRTAPEHRKRGTVNVGLQALKRLQDLQAPYEPMWETMNRILGIH